MSLKNKDFDAYVRQQTYILDRIQSSLEEWKKLSIDQKNLESLRVHVDSVWGATLASCQKQFGIRYPDPDGKAKVVRTLQEKYLAKSGDTQDNSNQGESK